MPILSLVLNFTGGREPNEENEEISQMCSSNRMLFRTLVAFSFNLRIRKTLEASKKAGERNQRDEKQNTTAVDGSAKKKKKENEKKGKIARPAVRSSSRLRNKSSSALLTASKSRTKRNIAQKKSTSCPQESVTQLRRSARLASKKPVLTSAAFGTKETSKNVLASTPACE
ncbi:unnamed protein product [Caenorhabditis sp. 36 PRJEB53466]|nr:unnamed protein product [Caenorhabditis sp. 36 PRJEB53466]